LGQCGGEELHASAAIERSALAKKFGEGLGGGRTLISRNSDRLCALMEELRGSGVADRGFVADAADLDALADDSKCSRRFVPAKD
jgi:hypothetical protein